jgi:hypothetical protein
MPLHYPAPGPVRRRGPFGSAGQLGVDGDLDGGQRLGDRAALLGGLRGLLKGVFLDIGDVGVGDEAGLRWTLASVSTEFGLKPAFSRPAENAIEKHPAWAAAINSSGLVPTPSSNRDEKEYCPSKAPPPSRMFPLPSLRPPSQRAFAVRAGMDPPRWCH